VKLWQPVTNITKEIYTSKNSFEKKNPGAYSNSLDEKNSTKKSLLATDFPVVFRV
jgi:hypothetical protein